MGKDPLEREREFREMIERAAAERREARLRRRFARRVGAVARVLSPLAAPFLAHRRLTLALAVSLAFGSLFLFLFGVSIKWTEAYACALSEARRSPVVLAEIGEPVRAGFFAWSFGYSQELSVTDTSFQTTLAGPEGEGTLRVAWYKAPIGTSLRMVLVRDGRMIPVYSGPIPCR